MHLRRILHIISLAIFLSLTFSTVTMAAESVKSSIESQENDDIATDTENISTSVGFTFMDVVKTIFSLIVVGSLLYIVPRFLLQNNRVTKKGQVYSNLGGVNLGNNKSVQLVKIGDCVYVLGVGENVQLLEQITDSQQIKKFINRHDNVMKPKDIFNQIVHKKKDKTKSVTEEKPATPKSFSSQFKKQLVQQEAYTDIEIEKKPGKGEN